MQPNNGKRISVFVICALVLALVLSACGGSETPAPTQGVAMIQTQAAQTVVADLTAAAPVTTQVPAATVAPTQAPLPGPTPNPNIPVAVVPTAAPGQPSASANFNTSIFSGPSENYVVYGAFLGGQTASVIGKSEDGLWWAISVPVAPDGTGWVSGGWVTVYNADGVPVLPTPPVPDTVEMVPPGPDDPQATAIANVFVRTGPATNFPAFGIAPAGATGRVIGQSEDGQWWVVRLNPTNVGAGYGWVMAQYTEAKNVEGVQVIKTPPSPVTQAPPPPPAGVPTATSIDFVNVRSGPGTNYAVLVVAPPGAAGEVSGQSADGQWWQVKISTQYAPDGLGWVSAGWVTTQNTGSVPVVDAPPAPPTLETTPPSPPSGATGCRLVSQTPADATVFTPGAGFTTTWVLQNSGTKNWSAGEVDITFAGAVENIAMHQGADRYDLSSTVEPGWTYSVSVPMIAPFDPGTYGELWQLVQGNQPICQFYVYVNVQ